jgi:hypothetical protein
MIRYRVVAVQCLRSSLLQLSLSLCLCHMNAQAQLHVPSGERLFVTNADDLVLSENLNNNGTIDHLTLGGASSQAITGTGTIRRLKINKSAGIASITSGMQTITGVLTPTAGTLAADGYLTLKSDLNGTARVAAGAAAGGYVTGNVIAERFIPLNTNSGGTGRAWRLVTIPVSGTGTLRNFFMNGSNGKDLTNATIRNAEASNSGTAIVGHNYASATAANNDGFDWIGVANQVSSLRSFVANASGGTFLSENVPNLTSTDYSSAAQGYMVFVRGDRKEVFPGTTSSSATTFRSTGTLKTGDQSVMVQPGATHKYTLVGNPFMSVLDLSSVHTHNSTVIKPSFWIWDANIAGTYKQGGYVNVFHNGSAWITNTGTYVNPQRIESGTAFFVEPVTGLATATAINIKETHKSSDATAGITSFGNLESSNHGLVYVRLENAAAGGLRQIVDGAVIDFADSFRESLGDLSDREKMRNTISHGSLWLSREQKILSSEGLPFPGNKKQSVPLYLGTIGVQKLNLRVHPQGMSDKFVRAWLKDHYLKQENEVDMNDGLDYDFTGTGHPATDSNRFELVFVESGKSGSGQTPEPDNVAGLTGIKLYPNPRRSSDFWLSLRQLEPGHYNIEVIDMSGRLVTHEMINHTSLSTKHQILRSRKLSPGQYMIRITANGTPLISLPFIQE